MLKDVAFSYCFSCKYNQMKDVVHIKHFSPEDNTYLETLRNVLYHLKLSGTIDE